MKQYFIKSMDKKDFSAANVAMVDNFQWREGHTPKTEARVIFVKGEGFHVQLKSWETNLRITCKEYQGRVCEDSCMEFFFNFAPDTQDKYVNFETNPIGTINSSLGKGRRCRKKILEIWGELPEVKGQVFDDYWQVEYLLPMELLEKSFGTINTEKGAKYTGNFYKCGDKTDIEHYGMWSPVDLPEPDYHRPEFFGELIMD